METDAKAIEITRDNFERTIGRVLKNTKIDKADNVMKREVRSLISQGKPIINLGIGSPDLRPPPEVINALKNADVHGYQNYQGIPELRHAIAKFYQKHYSVSLQEKNEILDRKSVV